MTERFLLSTAVALYFLIYGAAAVWRKKAPMFRRAGIRHGSVAPIEGRSAVRIGVAFLILGVVIATTGALNQ
jgi:hypothetical protein